MLNFDLQTMIFEFVGGLGIFLFGIKYMGEGLKAAAGGRLRAILDRFTTNPFMGVLAGIFITALIQSSSGTTALTVALVSAGFMTFHQAIGVIMGANIGTTVTSFIIGIDIGEYALPIIATGSILLFFFKSKKINALGQIIFGFGTLFFGLELMSSGMKPLRSLDEFQQITVSMSDNAILSVLVGTIFTIIVQSSSATIGILQELFAQGALNLRAALPVLFGDNIGTTITAILAAIGTSISAKRVAVVHVLFNLLGTVIFLLVLGPFTNFIAYLQSSLNLNPEMTIAFAHGIFNVTNTIIQFPFIAAIAWLVTKIIPGEDRLLNIQLQHLSTTVIEQSPNIALGQAKNEVKRMGEFAADAVNEAFLFLNNKEQKHASLALQYEQAINQLDKVITEYLVTISTKSLSPYESKEHNQLMDTIRDIERVGDHMENIVELLEDRTINNVSFSDEAIIELNEMFELTNETFKKALQAFFTNNVELASTVFEKEKIIDQMERDLRNTHIKRMNERVCTSDAGILFVDIASNLERIGDHAASIAHKTVAEDHL